LNEAARRVLLFITGDSYFYIHADMDIGSEVAGVSSEAQGRLGTSITSTLLNFLMGII
jgi:hypothetical protein